MKSAKQIHAILERGVALHRAGQLEQAKQAYLEVIKYVPKEPNANRLVGVIYMQQKDLPKAQRYLRAAAENAPKSPDNHYYLGRLHIERGNLKQAHACLDECLRLAPEHESARLSRAALLMHAGKYHETISEVDIVLAANPRAVDALVKKATALAALSELDEAWKMVDLAIATAPSSPDVLMKRAHLHMLDRSPDRAAIDLKHVLRLHPKEASALQFLPQLCIELCDWTDPKLLEDFRNRPPEETESAARGKPFASLMFISWKGDPILIKQHAARYASIADVQPDALLAAPPTIAERDRKLRVGYLSADLRQHAVGQLFAGVIAAHDRDRYDIINFSVLEDDPKDELRQFIQSNSSEVHFLNKMDMKETAQKIRAAKTDIVVDLNGWTAHSRLAHLMYRPAPIQMNYLGYPGTSGAEYIDYIIGDAAVTPVGHEDEFTEKVIRLPNSYLPFDRTRQPEIEIPTRAECGLPEDATVFCVFNGGYKLTDDLADVWARILKRVPDSILWFRFDTDARADNLRREFEARGIAPSRLAFAAANERFARHIGRQSHAAMFLDTFYYNAHTTGLDALWAGLPVVTRVGTSFAGRVGASLLGTLGLPDLITRSAEEYEALAVDLALNPEKLAGYKARIAELHQTSPLFDSTQTARHLEMAYTMAWQRACDGLPPASFDVPRIA